MTRGFTPKQGRYLAFIHEYRLIHRRAPAEADMQQYFGTSPPAVHQMVLTLEKRGLITRTRGQPRSIVLRVAAEHLPPLGEAEAAQPATAEVQGENPLSRVETVTRIARAVVTKLFEQCDAHPLDDSEFLPLVGSVASAVEQELRTAGVASADCVAAKRHVEDFAVEVYVGLCARNDPEGADPQEDAETCRRLMARGRALRG